MVMKQKHVIMLVLSYVARNLYTVYLPKAEFIESTFFLVECLTVVQWGYLSDRYSRRPVLLIGPLGLSYSLGYPQISGRLSFSSVCREASMVTWVCLQGVSKTDIAEVRPFQRVSHARF